MTSDAEGVVLCPGRKVRRDSVFRVRHARHRKSHLAVVLEGQELPPCAVCGTEVRYEPVVESVRGWGSDHINQDPDFLEAES